MTDPPQDDDLPDIPKRSLHDLIRFEEWQIKEQRELGELKMNLRAETEKLFMARSWPSIADIISAFRVYAEGVFDLNAERLLEEEPDNANDYVDRLRLKAKDLDHIFGSVVCHPIGPRTWDSGQCFSVAKTGGIYQEIMGAALDLRARAKVTRPPGRSCCPRAVWRRRPAPGRPFCPWARSWGRWPSWSPSP